MQDAFVLAWPIAATLYPVIRMTNALITTTAGRIDYSPGGAERAPQ